MKRSKVSLVLGAALACGLATTLAIPASADPVPQARDIVGVGSDTSEYAVTNLADGVVVGGTFRAGYNAAASARLVSFNATGSSTVVLKAGTAAITRPNGSGAGKNALYSPSNPNVNFARSSSTLTSSEISAGLRQVPFAVDGLKLATATTSNAPATITPAQMVQIYSGAVTNWNQLGGQNGTIVPLIPQVNSGTRAFFLAQLQAANGGAAVTLAGSVTEVQEHDAAPIAASPNAVAPFSTGRFASVTGIKLEGGFTAQRALYNVVRAADLNAPWFSAIFGSDGYLCSGAAKAIIAASGFQQLAHPFDDGVCGEPTQDATSNFATS